MINKECRSIDEAIAPIGSGASILIGGFGKAGMPDELVGALIRRDVTDLTIISNNDGNGETGVAALIKTRSGDRWARWTLKTSSRPASL